MGKWSGTKRIVCSCVAGGAILALVYFGPDVIDPSGRKMGPNQFLSPWDKSAAPPAVQRPSRVVALPDEVREQAAAVENERQRPPARPDRHASFVAWARR